MGAIVGTPAYMAPEQILGGEADARSDIFSFGVVLYELLAGRHPFRMSTKVETMAAIVRETPLPPAGPFDAARHALFEKLLAKDPAGRFQAMADVGQQVRRLRERLGGSAGEDLFVPLPPPFVPAPTSTTFAAMPMTIDPFSPADSLDATAVHHAARRCSWAVAANSSG